MPATVLLFILPLLPLLPYSAAQAAWYAQPVQVTVGTGEFDLKNASTWMWCHHCADELDEVTGAQTKPFCTENEWDFDTAMKQCPSKYCQVSMRRFSKRVSDYPTVINHRAFRTIRSCPQNRSTMYGLTEEERDALWDRRTGVAPWVCRNDQDWGEPNPNEYADFFCICKGQHCNWWGSKVRDLVILPRIKTSVQLITTNRRPFIRNSPSGNGTGSLRRQQRVHVVHVPDLLVRAR